MSIQFSVQVVHSYTDNDNEENCYAVQIDGEEPILCLSMIEAGEVVKNRIISELLDKGCY